jgi:hypothetical protein
MPTGTRREFVLHNFVQTHSKYRESPAMAAGVNDRLWSMNDIGR